MTNIDTTKLNAFIERLEKLAEQKEDILNDIKGVLNEAKSMGFEIKPLKEVVRLKKIMSNPTAKSKQEQEEHYLEVYKNALNLG